MKKIAFVDHSHHKKTKSSLFFKKILEKRYKVDYYWDDSWSGNTKGFDFNIFQNNNYAIVIFWQVFPELETVQKIKLPIIWVPMYDSVCMMPKEFWERLAKMHINIISFSKKISEYLRDYEGLLSVQYYLKPVKYRAGVDKRVNIFFWDRGDINFNVVKKIVGKQKVNKIVYKYDCDPGKSNRLPSKEYMKKYGISLMKGRFSRRVYVNLLSKCSVFIQPRMVEGIGLAFIEAMAYGAAVISPDFPTMNEYIRDGYNGFLYNPMKIKEIDLGNLAEIRKNLWMSNNEGYREWLENTKKIQVFITKVIDENKRNYKYKLELNKRVSEYIKKYLLIFKLKIYYILLRIVN